MVNFLWINFVNSVAQSLSRSVAQSLSRSVAQSLRIIQLFN